MAGNGGPTPVPPEPGDAATGGDAWAEGPVRPRGRRHRGRFSRTELVHLAASLVALTVAFVIIQVVEPGEVLTDPEALLSPEALGRPLAIAVTVVVTGFLFHELAHKFVAQLYGHWSEFRASFPHLGLAVVVSVFGFLFAAPGAVNIVGDVDKRENGIISAVGPLTNVAMAAIFLVLWQGALRDPIGEVFFWGAFFNVILAGFNLIPVGPLDGAKVVRWNLGAYLLFLLLIVLELKVLFPAELSFIP